MLSFGPEVNRKAPADAAHVPLSVVRLEAGDVSENEKVHYTYSIYFHIPMYELIFMYICTYVHISFPVCGIFLWYLCACDAVEAWRSSPVHASFALVLG